MAKKYKLEIELQSSQFQQKIRDVHKLLGDADKSARQLAASLDRIFGTVSPKTQKFNDDLGKTHVHFVGLNRDTQQFGQQATAGFNAAANAVRGLGAELDKTKKKFKTPLDDPALGGIGYFKFVAESLKKLEKEEKDSLRKRLMWEKNHVIDVKSLEASSLKAKSDAINKQLQEEQRRFVSIQQMMASATKVKSDFIDKELKEEFGSRQEAIRKHLEEERRRFVSVKDLEASGLKAKSDAINKQIQEERRRFASVQQLEQSATTAKSKSIDQQLKEEMRFNSQFTRALTDREISQRVANEKMQRSNDERVQAAMKAAGLIEESTGVEVKANNRMIGSIGMMIVRFAAYHLIIGQTTQLLREYADATNKAAAAQDQALKGFVGDRESLRQLAGTLGRPNDNQLTMEVHALAANTRMSFGEARNFYKATAEGAQQYIVQPGENAADQAARNRKLTNAQFQRAMTAGMQWGQLHGLTDEHTAAQLAIAMGATDVRGLSDKEANEKIMQNFAVPSLVLEHGRGTTPVLQGQLAKHHATFGNQFRNMTEEAAFLSLIAQGTSHGEVFTSARALIQEIRHPDKDLQKLLKRVTHNGKPLLVNGAVPTNITDQEAIEDVRAYFDRQGLTGAARENEIGKYFRARTGLAAATQVFGERATAITKERLDFAAQSGTPQAIAADMAKRQSTEDSRLQKSRAETEHRRALRLDQKSELENIYAETTKAREGAYGPLYTFGRPGTEQESNNATAMRLRSGRITPITDIDISQYSSQERLLGELQKYDPAAAKAYQPFGLTDVPGFRFTQEQKEQKLLQLNRMAKQAREKAAKAGKFTPVIRTPNGGYAPDPAFQQAPPVGGPRASRIDGGPMGADNKDVVALLERTTKALEEINRRGERANSSGQTASHFPASHEPLPTAFLSGTLLS